MADKLAMCKSIGDEIFRRSVNRQQRSAVGRGKDRHRIVQYRWTTIDLLPCSNCLAVVERYAPDFWGNDFPNCAGTFRGTRKSIEQRRAGPVGQQYPHFAAFEAVRSVCQYAQLFRIRQVNGRFCRLCRIGQRHAEPIGYARRQCLIDIAQMRHRTRPNVEPLTFT